MFKAIDSSIIRETNKAIEDGAKSEGISVEEYKKRHPFTMTGGGNSSGGIFGKVSSILKNATENPLETAINVGRAAAGDPSGLITQAVGSSGIGGLDKVANIYNKVSNFDFNNISTDALKDKALDYVSGKAKEKATNAVNSMFQNNTNKIMPPMFQQSSSLQNALDQDIVPTRGVMPIMSQENNFEPSQDTAVNRQQEMRKRFSNLINKVGRE